MSRIGIIQRSVPTIGLLCVALSGGAQAPARSTSAEIRDIRYEVTFDNAMAWARRDFLLFNGTNLFLYPEGRPLTFGAHVTVHTDQGWRAVTGMHASGENSYEASSYHDLVDMPFFVGRFDLDSAQ